ncbi:MAG: plastocyanin/azurin family copper-binding protein [Croceibacterium sp.]
MPRQLIATAALFLSACATTHAITPVVERSAAAFAGSAPIEVTLANFDFTPPILHLHAGQAYRLTLHNVANGGHDFTAPEFFAAARIAPADAAEVAKGDIELSGGQSKSVHLIPASGRYKVVCTHLGHALLGMTGEIVVD